MPLVMKAKLVGAVTAIATAFPTAHALQLPHARSRAIDALTDAEEAVKRNPLVVVAIALGLGLLIGVLTRR